MCWTVSPTSDFVSQANQLHWNIEFRLVVEYTVLDIMEFHFFPYHFITAWYGLSTVRIGVDKKKKKQSENWSTFICLNSVAVISSVGFMCVLCLYMFVLRRENFTPILLYAIPTWQSRIHL